MDHVSSYSLTSFPYHPQWAMKETEDFSPMDYMPSYSSASFSLLSPYSCTYPPGIEYAGIVEKVEVEIEIKVETKVTLR